MDHPLKDHIEEAKRVVGEAERRGLVLRVMGATAFKIHCPKFSSLHNALKRELTDIDFMAYGERERETLTLFQDLGYTIDERMIYALRLITPGQRYIFHDFKNNRTVDVFFDRLEMCHMIDFRDRLEIDYPTIPVSDLLLEKMQIVKINEKDIKDSIVLLREHEVGVSDDEMVNATYIAKILSNDWGFWYTAIMNLNKVKWFASKYEALTKLDVSDIEAKINRLLEAIEREPKSFKWKMRARVGAKKKWYREVEEVVRN
jgi:hypothetical protein